MEWLEQLERESRGVSVGEVELWPETPYYGLQTRIQEAQGASDTEVSNPRSRPYQIVAALRERVLGGYIPNNFTLLDICCGDGLILRAIHEEFPDAICMGVDMNVGSIFNYDRDIRVYRIPLQSLVGSVPETRLDVTMMMNTFRSWSSAKLRNNEADIPDKTTLWLSRASRYSILTVHVRTLPYSDEMRDIGTGERDARMVEVTWTI